MSKSNRSSDVYVCAIERQPAALFQCVMAWLVGQGSERLPKSHARNALEEALVPKGTRSA
ncbi:hypothetical protein ATY81_02000 [Rhizobium sp. R72]|nr:hypothetical protein ATY81_02000 [Rhizobium sp. R72]OWW05830.1 hypothetical protein ATY80_02000 [Rhizobium sp. R711]